MLPAKFGDATRALYVLGGWNPGDTPTEQDYFPTTRANDIWKCASFANLERGIWTRVMRAAQWSPRHSFGCVEDQLDRVHVFGSDGQAGFYVMDHWIGGASPTLFRRIRPTNAGDAMPMSDRLLAIPGHLPSIGDTLMIGGETMPGLVGPAHAPVRRTDIWGYRESDGFWRQVIANCPALPRSAIQKAAIHSVAGVDYLYLFTGGSYDQADLNRQVWRCPVAAVGNAASWQQVTAVAAWPGRIYSCIESWDGKLWVICGNGAAGNLGDIWNSADNGATWLNTGLTIPIRHAAASCVWDDGGESRIVITGGSGDDHRKRDVWVIESV